LADPALDFQEPGEVSVEPEAGADSCASEEAFSEEASLEEASSEESTPEESTPEESTSEELAPEEEPAAETPDLAAPEAVREALARLSAAIGEDQAVPAGGLTPVPPKPAKPDSTVMVEVYDDAEPTAVPEPSPPLSEEEQLDLSPVENQDEELALGPIDIAGLEGVDLDKSHHAGGTVVKAKPMIKATPSGTIVPF
ncbi:MAG: hypothetical protein LBV21_04560, partial [Candidatus Adiutrix sp.]|nr:hypothetical protein [Candidatus Adiutrix sp.]